MPFFGKSIVDYPELKKTLLWKTAAIVAVVSILLAVWAPKMVIFYIGGAFLSYGYMRSLFLSSEHPQRKLAIGFAIFRMAIVSFLIVWLGGFQAFKTGVVLCGFLSYKVVLAAEGLRHILAAKQPSSRKVG